MKKLKDSERGYTLLGVLMVLMIFTVLGVSILVVTSNSLRISSHERDDQSVYYIAEAGLVQYSTQMNEEFESAMKNKVIPALVENDFKKTEEQKDPESIFYSIIESSLSTGEFTIGKESDDITFEKSFGNQPFAVVNITKAGRSYEITSIGNIGGKKRTVFQEVEVVYDSEFMPENPTPSNPEDENEVPLNACYALYTNGSFNGGSGTINGDIYSNEKLIIKNAGASLNGSIYSSKDIEIGGGTGIENVFSLENIIASGGHIKGNLISKKNIQISGYPVIEKDIIAKNNIMVKGWFANLTGNYKYGNQIDFEQDGNRSNQREKLKKMTQSEIEDLVNSMGSVSQNNKIMNDCTSNMPKLAQPEAIFKGPIGISRPEDEVIKGYNAEDVFFIKNGNLDMTHQKTNGKVLELDSDLYFKKIEITEDKKLYIDLKGASRTIYVDALKIPNGHIELLNAGTLNIQVLNNMKFGAGSSITNENKSNKTNTNIFYGGIEPLLIDGGVDLKSSLHIKDANLTVTAGGGVHGDIFVYGENNIKISGGSKVVEQLFLAPKSKFIHNNGVINGNVIAKEFEMSGGAKINPPSKVNDNPSNPSIPEDPEEIKKKYLLKFNKQVEI